MKILLAIAVATLFASPALAGNGGHMGGGNSATGIGIANSSSYNAGNHQSTRFNEKYQAPGVGSVGLTSTGVCPIGSVGFGISGPGAGLSFGATKGDTDCRNAYLIQQAGFGRKVLQQYLVNNVPAIRDAVFPKGK